MFWQFNLWSNKKQDCQRYRTLCLWEIFAPFQSHTYRTVFEPFSFSKKARCQTYRTLSSRKCPISLTTRLLREIEWLENCPMSMTSKRSKNLSQAKCPISLTVMYSDSYCMSNSLWVIVWNLYPYGKISHHSNKRNRYRSKIKWCKHFLNSSRWWSHN